MTGQTSSTLTNHSVDDAEQSGSYPSTSITSRLRPAA